MAERLNKRHSDEIRRKIQGSQLINRLQNFAMGEGPEMTRAQVSAAVALLDRCVAKLSQVEIIGDDDSPLQHKHEVIFIRGPNTNSGKA